VNPVLFGVPLACLPERDTRHATGVELTTIEGNHGLTLVSELGGARVAVGVVEFDAEHEQAGVLLASTAVAVGGSEGDYGDGAQASALSPTS
jgi:hypothetical protein